MVYKHERGSTMILRMLIEVGQEKVDRGSGVRFIIIGLTFLLGGWGGPSILGWSKGLERGADSI